MANQERHQGSSGRRDQAGGNPLDPERGRMDPSRKAARDTEASIPELLRRLSNEGAELVRQEIDLVRAEVRQKTEVVQRNAATMALGGALMFGGLLFALWALNTGLTALLVQVVAAEIAIWLAPLLLAVLLLGVGWAMFRKGKDTIAEEGIVPQESRESLREDRRWAKQKRQQIRKEVAQ